MLNYNLIILFISYYKYVCMLWPCGYLCIFINILRHTIYYLQILIKIFSLMTCLSILFKLKEFCL